jgi:hypothetical protein
MTTVFNRKGRALTAKGHAVYLHCVNLCDFLGLFNRKRMRSNLCGFEVFNL